MGKVKDETHFIHPHAKIQTQVVVIWGPARYLLEHRGAREIMYETYINYYLDEPLTDDKTLYGHRSYNEREIDVNITKYEPWWRS